MFLTRLLALTIVVTTAASAQLTRPANLLTHDAAQQIADGALREAARRGWQVAVAIVDPSGTLQHFSRTDGVQHASIDLAIGKARAAARFRRSTRLLAESLSQGRLGFLGLEGVVLLEGGLPITVDGSVVAGVGVSGMTGAQDAEIATAGLAAAGVTSTSP